MQRIKELCRVFNRDYLMMRKYNSVPRTTVCPYDAFELNSYGDEEIFLYYDASVSKRFKEGFIITNKGLHCKTLNSQTFIPFEKFLTSTEITLKNTYIYADEYMIACTYGISSGETKMLIELYEKIKVILNNFNIKFYIR